MFMVQHYSSRVVYNETDRFVGLNGVPHCLLFNAMLELEPTLLPDVYNDSVRTDDDNNAEKLDKDMLVQGSYEAITAETDRPLEL